MLVLTCVWLTRVRSWFRNWLRASCRVCVLLDRGCRCDSGRLLLDVVSVVYRCVVWVWA